MAWPVAAMDGGIDGETPRDVVEAALVDLVEKAGIDAPRALQGTPVADAPWFVLAERPREIAVATGPWTRRGPGQTGQVVYLRQVDGVWKAAGWGDCRGLAPVLDPGQQWVRVYGVSGEDLLSMTLTAMIGEVACSSGRDPRPYLLEPSIVETEDAVIVSWTSRSSGGGTCQGVPPVPQPFELTSALGDRILLDGSTWPMRRIPVRDRELP